MNDLTNFVRLLTSSGWKQQRPPNERVIVLNSPETDGDFFSVVLPSGPSYSDAALRFGQAVDAAAEYFKTSASALLDRVRHWDRDVLRTRLFRETYEIDVIPLKTASLVIDDLRSFVGFAAYTQQVTKPFFAKSGGIASDFTEHCYFGHTFRGSFGLTVECPLPNAGQMTIAEDLRDPPFERLVMQRIARGYSVLGTAVEREDPSLLVDGYAGGMNANMLRALSSVYERLDTLSVEYQIEWAPEISPQGGVPSSPSVRFDNRAYAIAKYAAERLEAEETPPSTTIVSYVVSLRSEMPVQDGVQEQFEHVITLDWEKERNVFVRIHVDLPLVEYRKACDAHRNGKKISITGRPMKVSKLWTLLNPSGVTFTI